MATSGNKTVLIVVAFVAGIVVGIIGSTVPVIRDSLQGLVTPADQHGASQATGDDAQLNDQALAELKRSDEFKKVISDPRFAALLADAAFAALLSDASFQAMMSDARFAPLFSDTNFANAFGGASSTR